VCGDIGGGCDGLSQCHGDSAGGVDAGSPALRHTGRLGGLRALGADGCDVGGGDGSKASGADINVGSSDNSGGGASRNTWVLRVLRFLGNGRHAVVAWTGSSRVATVALRALNRVRRVICALASRVSLSSRHWGHSRRDGRRCCLRGLLGVNASA
jgi:hypothetical protein